MATSSEAEIHAEIMAQIPTQVRDSGEARKVAREAAAYARSIAPVYQGKDTKRPAGTFRDSITDKDAPDVKGMPAAQIVSDDPAAQYIEYGTERTPEHGTFAKTRAHMQQQIDDREIHI